MKQIRGGEAVIDAQLNAGYESSSGFRDAFSQIMGAAPTKFNSQHALFEASWLDTPLGAMIAIADDEGLFLLEFVDRRGLEREVERLRIRTKAAIVPGSTTAILSIEKELKSYFEGTLNVFKTPLHLWVVHFKNMYGRNQYVFHMVRHEVMPHKPQLLESHLRIVLLVLQMAQIKLLS